MLTLHSLKVRCWPDQHVFFSECRELFKLWPKISFICLNMGCVVYLQSALVRLFENMWWPQNWFFHFPTCSGCNDKLWCLISISDYFRTTATLICITSSYTFMTNRPDWDFLSLLFFLFFFTFPQNTEWPIPNLYSNGRKPLFPWQPQ